MTLPTDTIGNNRPAQDLVRGDHVQLPDGRWALVTEQPVLSKPLRGDNYTHTTVAASLLVNQSTTEACTWPAGELVWSRDPAEQFRYMDVVLGDLKMDAIDARVKRDKVRAAGGAA